MKARKSILISTLLMAGCSLAPFPASAAVERDDRTYWTFEETWNLKTAIDDEVAAICGHDYGCELDYRFGLLDQPEYRMMGAMMFPSMVYMTAVNPKKETITLFYNDAGDWSTRALTGDRHFSLQEFTTFWVEDEDLNYSILNDARETRYYADSILSDSAAEEITPLFYGSAERDGEDWFEPNKEIEISVAGSGLARNRAGFIHQIGVSDSTFVGTFNYSDCLRSPDYRDGMECKLMYAEDGGMWYLPFAVEGEMEDPVLVESPTLEEIAPIEPVESPTLEEIVPIEPSLAETEAPMPAEVPAVEGNMAAETSTLIEKTPAAVEDVSIEMPAIEVEEAVGLQPEEQTPEPILVESQPEELLAEVALPNANNAITSPVSSTIDLNSEQLVEHEEPKGTKGLSQSQKDSRGFLSLVFAIMTAAAVGIIWLIIPFKVKKR